MEMIKSIKLANRPELLLDPKYQTSTNYNEGSVKPTKATVVNSICLSQSRR
jgi:hypothetical protein